MKKPRFKEDKQVDYWVYAYKKESKFVQFQWNQSFHIDFLQHLSHHHIDISLILNSLTDEGSGNPLQCSCLENSMGRRAWQAAVHGVTETQTWLNDQHTHTNSLIAQIISFAFYYTHLACILQLIVGLPIYY